MAVEEKSAQSSGQELDPEIESMIQAGVHFGHKTSKTHPKMLPYVAGIRNTVHVINLEKTKVKLEEAVSYLKQLKENNKKVLFVGTKLQIVPLVRDTAKALDSPYVTERWIGGTLTNFSEITKRFERLKQIEDMKQNEEEWEKYTKKEQATLEKELEELEVRFGGMKDLQQPPDALFVVDPDENDLAIREAKAKDIPVVALVDTNVNLEGIAYPIPANDDALSSVSYILGKIRESLGGAEANTPPALSSSEDERAETEE